MTEVYNQGIETIIFLADWHAMINDKLDGLILCTASMNESAVRLFSPPLNASIFEKYVGSDQEALT